LSPRFFLFFFFVGSILVIVVCAGGVSIFLADSAAVWKDVLWRLFFSGTFLFPISPVARGLRIGFFPLFLVISARGNRKNRPCACLLLNFFLDGWCGVFFFFFF